MAERALQSRSLVSHRGTQHGCDALSDGLQGVGRRHGNPSSPKQGGEDKGPNRQPSNLKGESRVGRVPETDLKLVQAKLERDGLARIQAEVNAKKLEIGADLVATSNGLGAPRATRLVCDKVALTTTASQPGRRVERVAASQRLLGLLVCAIWPGTPQDPVIDVDAGLNAWRSHVLSPKETNRQTEERRERAALQQAMVGAMPPF